MAKALGLWCNHKVSKFNFANTVPYFDFVIGSINSGTNLKNVGRNQYNALANPSWADFVQKAFDAGYRSIGGHYRMSVGQFPHYASQMYYWEHAYVEDNNPIVMDLASSVKDKAMQILILDVGDISLTIPASEKRIGDVWYTTIVGGFYDWVVDNIQRFNPRIKRVVLMHSKYIVDTYYPSCKWHAAFMNKDICSDYNIIPVQSLSNYGSIANMARPKDPMAVTYGSKWVLDRFANASFKTNDFDGPVGAVEFNGTPERLFAWTGKPNLFSATSGSSTSGSSTSGSSTSGSTVPLDKSVLLSKIATVEANIQTLGNNVAALRNTVQG
jgi:hypothetical protein